jgi:hypothetical protein
MCVFYTNRLQRLVVELVTGQWLLGALFRDSVGLQTNTTEEER